jgi:uncharacterized repeat protein (TIGR01451 family)
MEGRRRARTALLAVCGVLGLLVVAPAAQAHQVTGGSATCKLVEGKPLISFQADFKGFLIADKPISGTVKLNGTTVQTWDKYNTDAVDFSLYATFPGNVGANHIVASFTWPTSSGGFTKDVDCPKPPQPGIDLVKDGPATANAGDTVTYTFKVTNTGDVRLDRNTLVDDKCATGTLARTGANTADTTFDPGDVWSYSCTYVVPAGVESVTNTAKACGKMPGTDTQVCDTDTHTFPVPPVTPPVTPPETPPVTPPVTPPATTPVTTTPTTGGVLPETVVSGRARLRGASGCVHDVFTARVSGRSIAAVSFFVDGKLFKRFNSARSSYAVKIKPGRYSIGRHRVTARVRFLAASRTASQRLPLTFRHCARRAVAPRFTG